MSATTIAHAAVDLQDLLDIAVRRARSGELPFHYITAAEGVAWMLATGRLATCTAIALQQMTVREAARLLSRIAESCTTMEEVGRWLRENL